MATTIIQDILSKGNNINKGITEKIQALNNNNNKFKTDLTNKLKAVIESINAFKSTNLQSLTEAKNKLAAATSELEQTKNNLANTQQELNRVKNDLANTQNEMQNINATKNALEQKVRTLEEQIKQTELNYQNQINGIRQEMSDKFTQEKRVIQQEHDNQIAQFNQEKNALQQQIQNAEQAQQEANNNISRLQQEQNGLIQNLGTINEFLSQQLNLISQINTDQPEINDYTDLLNAIQTGLSGVIGEINQAVASNTTISTSSLTPLYDKFVSLSPDQQDNILQSLGPEYATRIREDMINPTPINKQNIQNILSRRYSGNLLRGGKRRRKTMKKLNRRTRRKMRGGYIYTESDDELKKNSRDVSNSRSSKLNSISNRKSKLSSPKSQRRTRRKLTK